MTFTFLDIIFIAIILLLSIICASKGFIKELFGKGALVLGIWIAVLFYKKLNPYIAKYIHVEAVSIVLSFLLIFLVVYLIMMIIRQIIGNIFEGEIFNGLDKTLGFFFGVVEGLAFVAVILILLAAQPWFDVSKLLNDSFFYNMLKGIIATPVDSLSNMTAFNQIHVNNIKYL